MAKPGQNIGILITSIVLALILWGYVTMTRVYEDDVEIPLLVIPPPNQALLSTVPHTITARVRGTGLQIFNLQYIARDGACEIDLGRVRSESSSMFNIEREDIIRGLSVGGSLRVVSVTPTAMTLTTGDVFVRNVDVQLESNITARDGFIVVGEPRLEPATVEVRGTRSVVESITQWPTMRLSLADLHAPTVETVTLSDSLRTLLNFVPNTVKVHIDVQQAAERTIVDVPVHVLADDATLGVEPMLVQVTVRGGADQLAALHAEDVSATVPGTKLGPMIPSVTIQGGMKIISVVPSTVRVTRRQP